MARGKKKADEAVGDQCLLCADTVLCNGDSVVSKTEKVPVLMELTFWWRKTDKTQGDKQDNFR